MRQAVSLSREFSILAQQAENRKENRYWQFRTFRSDYQPQLSLNGTLPAFNRDIRAIPNPATGNDIFVTRRQLRTDLELNLSQNIAPTGGQIFMSSSLQRIDTFGDDFNDNSYFSQPLSVGFVQPLFAYNALKWDKLIEPLRYEESVRAYNEDMERISLQTVQQFFRLLLAQTNLRITRLNLSNNDTIYQIAKGRYQLGKIAENELLQLELNVVNSEQNLARAQLDAETAALELNTLVGTPAGSIPQLVVPDDLPAFTVDAELALNQARDNRQQWLSLKRRQLEAESQVARARGDNGLQIDIFGIFGLTKQANDFGNVYQNPDDQQQLRVGFSIPILDWGRQQARIKTALANQDLVQNTLQLEQIQFEQGVRVLVRQLEIARQGVLAAQKAAEVSQRSYDIARNRYLIAKISITDLNIALQQKDQSQASYIAALSTFWTAYYELRAITLYDFIEQRQIAY